MKKGQQRGEIILAVIMAVFGMGAMTLLATGAVDGYNKLPMDDESYQQYEKEQ